MFPCWTSGTSKRGPRREREGGEGEGEGGG